MSPEETSIPNLIEQFVAPDGWPEPRVFEEILARGVEAVEPLRALIRRGADREISAMTLSFAVDLLGSLGDPSAVPELFDLFRQYDDLEIMESAKVALRTFGPEMIDPALEIARDGSLAAYPRDTALGLATSVAGDDPDARARVATTIRELLSDHMKMGEQATWQDKEWAAFLVCQLSDLADPLARELIDVAYQARMVDTAIIGPKDVERAYRQGSLKRDYPPSSWLPDYQKQYEGHLDWLRRNDEAKAEALSRPPMPPPASPAPPLPPVATIRNTTLRPGRNDPCWCGSGKKYKNCHLREDQGQG